MQELNSRRVTNQQSLYERLLRKDAIELPLRDSISLEAKASKNYLRLQKEIFSRKQTESFGNP
jgi:hypothetical protein